jgi:ribonuclease HI
MIRGMMDAPWTLNESKHNDLLQNIVNALYARSEKGGKTHMYKVRSHTGVVGNEVADEAAGKVAKNPTNQPPRPH